VGECEELSTQGCQERGSAGPPDDPGNATVDFHGEKRSNQTHASKTDPDAKMARKGKGKEAKLSYNGNLLIENRNGLIVNTEVFEANGTAERDAAMAMLEQIPGTKQVTVGGDKAYDTADFVAECRNLKVTPHVAQNLERPGGSAIDARTTQHAGYAISQRKRKRIEECYGLDGTADLSYLRLTQLEAPDNRSMAASTSETPGGMPASRPT
jgi:hypothetical protein